MQENDVPLTRDNYIVLEYGPGDPEVDESELPEPFRMASGATLDDFDPNEPRVGGGSPEAGRWTTGGGGGGKAAVTVHTPSHTVAVVHHPHVTVEPNAAGEMGSQPAQQSWESQPGATSRNMPEMAAAPLAQRREYHKAIEGVLLDDTGRDVISAGMGLASGVAFNAPGSFEGKISPGTQSTSWQPHMLLSDDQKARLTAAEAVRGRLLRQDAAAWHRPRFVPQVDTPYLVPTLQWKGKDYTGDGPTHKDALAAMPDDVRADFLANGGNETKNFKFKNDKGEVLDRKAARKYAVQNSMIKPGRFDQPELISEDLQAWSTEPQKMLRPEDANLLDFRLGRTLTDAETLAVTKALSGVGGGFYSPIDTREGFRVLNVADVSGIDNPSFKAQVVRAVEAADDVPDLVLHAAVADSDYVSNDWKEHPDGQGYGEAIAGLGRSNVERTADKLYARLGPQIAAVEDDFAKRYGWTPDRQTRFWEHPEKVAAPT